MVNLGPFSVQLLHAESKMPFKEHLHNGQAYVEAEPNADYFISIKMGDSNPPNVCVTFTVDGQSLNYNWRPGKSFGHVGLWQIENGNNFHRALRFVKPKVGTKSDAYDEYGKIKIDMYEAKNTPCNFYGNFKTEMDDRSDSHVVANPAQLKKVVHSAQGITSTLKVPYSPPKWSKGDYLATFTFHYCTAEALIALGVLPRAPPTTVGNRRSAAAAALISPASSPNVLREPKRIRVENGVLGVHHEYDFFDLTGEATDSDSEAE